MISNKTLKTIIGYIILPIVLVLVCAFVFSNIKIKTNNTNETKYKDLSEFISNTDYSINIPNGMITCNDSEVIVMNGPFIQIGCEHVVIKISPFVDVNADPLGLYEYTEIDYKYEVTNNIRTFFRYRIYYPELETCTIVNWVQGEYMYGAILSGVREETEIRDMLGIEDKNIVNYTDKSAEEYFNAEEMNISVIVIPDKYAVTLPKIKHKVSTVEIDKGIIFYINNKRLFAILDTDDENFNASETIELKHGYVIKYNKENPFKEEDAEYKDAEKVLNSIEEIAKSVDFA